MVTLAMLFIVFLVALGSGATLIEQADRGPGGPFFAKISSEQREKTNNFKHLFTRTQAHHPALASSPRNCLKISAT